MYNFEFGCCCLVNFTVWKLGFSIKGENVPGALSKPKQTVSIYRLLTACPKLETV